MRRIDVSEFQANFMRLIESIQANSDGITLVCQGRPVARLLPPLADSARVHSSDEADPSLPPADEEDTDLDGLHEANFKALAEPQS